MSTDRHTRLCSLCAPGIFIKNQGHAAFLGDGLVRERQVQAAPVYQPQQVANLGGAGEERQSRTGFSTHVLTPVSVG